MAPATKEERRRKTAVLKQEFSNWEEQDLDHVLDKHDGDLGRSRGALQVWTVDDDDAVEEMHYLRGLRFFEESATRQSGDFF